jgi:hypothetical protein
MRASLSAVTLTERSLADQRSPYLTLMADAGIPVHVLRKIAGHSSISTTQRYLHQGSGIASGGQETAGGQVNVPSERCLEDACDRCLTRADRHALPSDPNPR